MTTFTGGKPQRPTRGDWADQLRAIMSSNGGSQRATSCVPRPISLLPECETDIRSNISVKLQEPGANKKRPLVCEAAVHADGGVVYTKEGEPVRLEVCCYTSR